MKNARSIARVRRIALAMPAATERLSHGEPTFFAGKRVFAMCSNDHHGDGHVAVWVPAPPGVQEQLIVQDPAAYYRPPYVGVKGWIGVELANVSDETLRFHIESAWEMVAPKKAITPAATGRPPGSAAKRRSATSKPSTRRK